MAVRTEKDRVEKVLVDLLTSHDQLMAGVQHITCDYMLLNQCRIDAAGLLNDIRLGETRVERWKLPGKDELQLLIGEDDEL